MTITSQSIDFNSIQDGFEFDFDSASIKLGKVYSTAEGLASKTEISPTEKYLQKEPISSAAVLEAGESEFLNPVKKCSSSFYLKNNA